MVSPVVVLTSAARSACSAFLAGHRRGRPTSDTAGQTQLLTGCRSRMWLGGGEGRDPPGRLRTVDWPATTSATPAVSEVLIRWAAIITITHRFARGAQDRYGPRAFPAVS